MSSSWTSRSLWEVMGWSEQGRHAWGEEGKLQELQPSSPSTHPVGRVYFLLGKVHGQEGCVVWVRMSPGRIELRLRACDLEALA